MNWSKLLLCLSVGLDLAGLWFAAVAATFFWRYGPAFLIPPECIGFGVAFGFMALFFGAYSYLRWPWMPYRQLVQRWLLVVCMAMASAGLLAWLLKLEQEWVWRSPSAPLSLFWFCWSGVGGHVLFCSLGKASGQGVVVAISNCTEHIYFCAISRAGRCPPPNGSSASVCGLSPLVA